MSRSQVPRSQVPRSQVSRSQVSRSQVPRSQVPRSPVPDVTLSFVSLCLDNETIRVAIDLCLHSACPHQVYQHATQLSSRHHRHATMISSTEFSASTLIHVLSHMVLTARMVSDLMEQQWSRGRMVALGLGCYMPRYLCPFLLTFGSYEGWTGCCTV